MRRSGYRAELGLGLVLVVAAMGLELFWVRPAANRWERAAARRSELPALAVPSGARVSDGAGGDAASPDAAEAVSDSIPPPRADRRPMEVIEAAQAGRGLVQRQLRMIDRRDEGAVRRTTYAMEIYGGFGDVLGFLETLETRSGQVDVDRFRMVTASGDPGVTLFLWMSVSTPGA